MNFRERNRLKFDTCMHIFLFFLSSDPFVVTDSTSVSLEVRQAVLSTKRTETSVERADWRNVSKLEWIKMVSGFPSVIWSRSSTYSSSLLYIFVSFIRRSWSLLLHFQYQLSILVFKTTFGTVPRRWCPAFRGFNYWCIGSTGYIFHGKNPIMHPFEFWLRSHYFGAC